MNRFLINSTNIINITVAITIMVSCIITSLVVVVGPQEIIQYIFSIGNVNVSEIGDAIDRLSLDEFLRYAKAITIVGGIIIGIIIASLFCGMVATLIDIRKQLVILNKNGGISPSTRVEPT